jgi:hypothetical protein
MPSIIFDKQKMRNIDVPFKKGKTVVERLPSPTSVYIIQIFLHLLTSNNLLEFSPHSCPEPQNIFQTSTTKER